MKRFLKLVLGLLVLPSATTASAQAISPAKGKLGELQQQAQQYLQQQKPQLAIPIFRQIISLDPQEVNAHGDLGVLLFFQKDYAEAITEMRTALRLQPSLWRIEALLGIAEKRTGDLAAAETHLGDSFPNLDDPKIQ
jgi:Flp pilus assembly protein TadD